ncbi:MAG: cupredoxin domain-containing protein [Proteobacteria bacterium]|nr:cupredoxin domain-containing protein [Pseudomonadota bacterium]
MQLAMRAIVLAAMLSAGMAGPLRAAEHSVTMAFAGYSPAALTARVGDVIRFKNDDGEGHEVLVPTKGFGVDLGLQKPNETTELMLLKAGAFDVECVIHDHMHMRVTVNP